MIKKSEANYLCRRLDPIGDGTIFGARGRVPGRVVVTYGEARAPTAKNR